MVDVWTPLGRRQISTPDEEWQRDQERFRQQAAAQMAMQQEALKAQREMEGGRLALARETTTPWQADQSFRAGLFNRELDERKRTTPGWDQAAWLQERLQGSFADRAGAQERLQEGALGAQERMQGSALGAQERIAGINMAPNQTYADIAKQKFGRQLNEEDRQREFMDMIMNSETAPRFMKTLTPEQQNAIVLMTAGKRGGFDPSSFVQSMLEKNANIKAQRAQAASLLQNAGLTNMAMDYMDPENPMAQVSRQIGAQVASGEPTEIPSIGPLATQLESEFKAMYDKDTSDYGKDPDETDQQNFLRKWDRAMQQIANSVPPEAAGKVAQRMLERITQIMQKGEDRITRIPGISWARTDVSQSLIEKMRRSPLYNQLTGGN